MLIDTATYPPLSAFPENPHDGMTVFVIEGVDERGPGLYSYLNGVWTASTGSSSGQVDLVIPAHPTESPEDGATFYGKSVVLHCEEPKSFIYPVESIEYQVRVAGSTDWNTLVASVTRESSTSTVKRAAAVTVPSAGTYEWRTLTRLVGQAQPVESQSRSFTAGSSTLPLTRSSSSYSGSYYDTGDRNLIGLNLPSSSRISMFAAGANASAVVLQDGTLWTWGHGAYNGQGDGFVSYYPKRIGADSDWAQVFSNQNGTYFLALKTDGRLYGWGSFGASFPLIPTALSPAPLFTSYRFKHVAVENNSFIGITTASQAFCYGNNANGQLGLGHKIDVTALTRIGSASTWDKVALGAVHSMLLAANQNLYTSGSNGYGQLGTGNTTEYTTHVSVQTGVISCDSGGHYSLAIKADGIYVCGTSASHQQGSGSTSNVLTFTRRVITTTQTNARISAIYNGWLVSLDGGQIWACGDIGFILPSISTLPITTPVQIAAYAAGTKAALQTSNTIWIY